MGGIWITGSYNMLRCRAALQKKRSTTLRGAPLFEKLFLIGIKVIPLGFKPKTFRTGICCSIQLSYGTLHKDGVASPYIKALLHLNKYDCKNTDFI